MSKANDLEGRQDMGGKHGGQAGMPATQRERDKSDRGASDHGIVQDGQGQDQPADKSRAQHVSRKDKGGDPPGDAQQ